MSGALFAGAVWCCLSPLGPARCTRACVCVCVCAGRLAAAGNRDAHLGGRSPLAPPDGRVKWPKWADTHRIRPPSRAAALCRCRVGRLVSCSLPPPPPPLGQCRPAAEAAWCQLEHAGVRLGSAGNAGKCIEQSHRRMRSWLTLQNRAESG